MVTLIAMSVKYEKLEIVNNAEKIKSNFSENCPNFTASEVCYSCGKITCVNKNCPHYCKNCSISRNDEHIPPKALFEQNKGYIGYLISPQNKRRVSSCYACNNDYSENDEYFVNIITMHSHGLNNPIAKYASYKKRLKGIKGNKKLVSELSNTCQIDVPVYSEKGIYLSNVSGTVKCDASKLHDINKKIIKGYYLKNFNKILKIEPKHFWNNFLHCKNGRAITANFSPEENMILNVIEHNLESNREIISQMGGDIFHEEIQKNVFSYGFITHSENNFIFWYLKFYDCCKFLYAFALEE